MADTESPKPPPPAPPPVAEAAAPAAKVFPCERCGADLTFHIGQQALSCSFCGHVKTIALGVDVAIVEKDYAATLARLQTLRAAKQSEALAALEVRCGACGATLRFSGTVVSTECAYCGGPLQRADAHTAAHRLPTDAVLTFKVKREVAQEHLRSWVRSRWFAPGDFKKRGVNGRFNGVYLPFWTFDSMTSTQYRGQRGEHYWVEVGSGKNKRSERRTRWYAASGAFQRFFDDVLICAMTGAKHTLLQALEPWPLERLLPMNQEALAGYLALTYDLPLEEGFVQARARMDEALLAEARRRIGGDEQRIDAITSSYDALTYKHVLLPVWMLAYPYRDKTYQVVVNACTGEVSGERPWSAWKIAFAVLTALVLFAVLFSLAAE